MRYFVVITLIIVVIAFLFAYKSQDLKRVYNKEVALALEKTKKLESDILTVEDIRHLPEAVQKYLIYTGSLGKEKVFNMRVMCEGDFKTHPEKEWTKVETNQYNFFKEPTRIYYLKLKMFGIPVMGLHAYSNATASMLIKLGGLVTVAEGKGIEMNKAETVTIFNDMCLMAPASLIDERIKWEVIDNQKVRAYFTNEDYTISAELSFNDKGQLINFVSDDRYYSPTGKTLQKARWSTPVKDYADNNGRMLPSYGEAIWNFSEGDYCYARLSIKEVDYNCTDKHTK